MPRVPRGLKHADAARNQFEVLLLLGHRVRGVCADELIGLLPQLRGPDSDRYLPIRRLIRDLAEAGYHVEQGTAEEFGMASRGGRGAPDAVALRLVDQPFVPVTVTPEELGQIMPLVAAHQAARTARPPLALEICRGARAAGMSVGVGLKDGDWRFQMLPAFETMSNDAWYAVGFRIARDGSLKPCTVRLDGDFEFALGGAVSSISNVPLDPERMLSALTWDPGREFEATLEIQAEASESATRLLKPATCSSEWTADGWLRLVLRPTNKRLFFARVAQLFTTVRSLGPSELHREFMIYLKEMRAIAPVEEGPDNTAVAVAPRPRREQGDGPEQQRDSGSIELGEPEPGSTIKGGAPGHELVGRIVLILAYLDRHRHADVAKLKQLTGLPEGQVDTLISCFDAAQQALASQADVDPLFCVKRDGDKLAGIAAVKTSLLASTKRYAVAPEQLFAAASVAASELASTNPGGERKAALETLCAKVVDATGIQLVPSTRTVTAYPSLKSLLARAIDHEVSVRYTNPWRHDTQSRKIVPLAKPRRHLGQWAVDALDLEDDATAKVFFLDLMDASSVVVGDDSVSHDFDAAAIEAHQANLGAPFLLRVRRGRFQRYLIHNWGAREVQRESVDCREVVLHVRVFPPVADRLWDLYFEADGAVRIQAPAEWRDFGHECAARLLEHHSSLLSAEYS